MPKTAILAGATGLVGSSCLRRLASDSQYSQVVALVRRPSNNPDRKHIERVVGFDNLSVDDIAPGANVFCALGTTIRKAGSKQAFREVDFGHVVNLARRTADLGARQFVVVSSAGAGAATSNFYLQTKTGMEQAISAMPFQAAHIFRPSFLMGQRQESRPGERAGIVVAKALAFALIAGWRKYRAIEADVVAAAMVNAARKGKAGVHIYHYDEIHQLAADKS
jgi:uncharacterized protein YbjT (DUF2867 family)